MKCYYEILNVARDADDATIKSAYKKLALKWHPDKNLDNPEEAKEQFQLIQQAYDVLGDRQERAWYDNHRDQILLSADADFQDNCLNVYQYFTTSCFKGFGDDEKGFYTVYRKVFEEIVKEDLEFMDNKEDLLEIPSFGDSKSDYDSVVGPFYAYWSSYSTKKPYVWLDAYKVTEVRGGKILKLMDKENKKIRQKAKKERNEEVRSLVAFVKKRDKRVQTYAKLQETRKLENRKKQEQISKQKRLERQKLLNESNVEAEWTKFDNFSNELKEIEKHLASEFGEELSDSEEETSDSFDNLYCPACNKLFKTPKSFKNHEASKKHRENLEKLRETLLQDEEFLKAGEESIEDLDNDNVDAATIDSVENVDDQQEENLNSDIGIDQEDDNTDICSDNTENNLTDDKRAKKKKKQKRKSTKNSEHNEELVSTSFGVENDLQFNSSEKQRRKHKKCSKDSSLELQKEKEITENKNQTDENLGKGVGDPVNNDSEFSEELSNSEKIKPKMKVKHVKKIVGSKNSEKVDASPCCATCHAIFPSKNKLFDHLKKTGHSVYLPPVNNKKGRKHQ